MLSAHLGIGLKYIYYKYSQVYFLFLYFVYFLLPAMLCTVKAHQRIHFFGVFILGLSSLVHCRM